MDITYASFHLDPGLGAKKLHILEPKISDRCRPFCEADAEPLCPSLKDCTLPPLYTLKGNAYPPFHSYMEAPTPLKNPITLPADKTRQPPKQKTCIQARGPVDFAAFALTAGYNHNICANLHIGENVRVGLGFRFGVEAPIVIGRNTTIGASVTIATLKTPTDPKQPKGAPTAEGVTIGDNVYIGHGVIVEAGVTIGDNAIIKAGSVVTENIPANRTASGSPAFAYSD